MVINQWIFSYIVYSWIGIAILLFPFLLKITAPYGRHTKSGWGLMINNQLGWFIMESPALFVFMFFAIPALNFHDLMTTIAIVLWGIHYVHRSLIFPWRLKDKEKKMPVVIMVFAIFFNFMNGFINGYWFGNLAPGYSLDWSTGIRMIIGVIIFFTGYAINLYHDKILIKLRSDGNGEYKIPYGGLFRFVSCPNFLGEIIEWSGFVIITWCLPSLSFLVWTIVNLVPRALDHHRWYRNKFSEYPGDRKAVIPFVL